MEIFLFMTWVKGTMAAFEEKWEQLRSSKMKKKEKVKSKDEIK